MTIVVYDEIGLFSARPASGGHSAPSGRAASSCSRAGGHAGAPSVVLLSPASSTARLRSSTPASIPIWWSISTRSPPAARDHAAQIVDARPRRRFHAEVPEPRPGLKGGHNRGASTFPWAADEDGAMKAPEALRALFSERGIDLDRPLITSCGSGITAVTLALGPREAGAEDVAFMTDSWAEWGARPDADHRELITGRYSPRHRRPRRGPRVPCGPGRHGAGASLRGPSLCLPSAHSVASRSKQKAAGFLRRPLLQVSPDQADLFLL